MELLVRRPETMQHAMLCFARLVRALLGQSAIAANKLACGLSLTVLGVDIVFSPEYYVLRPAREKVLLCRAVMQKALEPGGVLHAGCAQKLAGRLSWATTYLFHRLGRAMLRPIFRQKFSGRGEIGQAFRIALKWWVAILELEIAEQRAWTAPERPPVYLFVDARGKPARCAAVLYIDGVFLYTDGMPAQRFMDRFEQRSDNNITSLEILAIAVGLSTFQDEIAGRKVVLFSDNTGAEVRA